MTSTSRMLASRRVTGGGIVGSAVALLCCAGVAPVIGIVSAVGVGFLLRDAILVPLLIVFLGVTVWGLWRGRLCHGRRGALLVGVVAGLITVGGVLAWIPLAFAGFAGVILAGIWNFVALRACAVAPPPTST